MLMGMTGFGRAQFRDKQIELTLQMSSLNHRFFEAAFHLPENLIYLEDRIKQILHKTIKRGRVTLSLYISGKVIGKVFLDRDLAKQYAQAIRALRQELSLKEEVSLAQLSALSGVLNLKDNSLPEEIVWPKIERLLSIASRDLLKMRFREGRAIEKDTFARLNTINKRLSFIKQRLPKVVAARRRRLADSGVNIDEINAAVKNCDIAEEITRLAFHLKSFAAKIKSNKKCLPLGKELDFIAQEMQRETNTMGAKAQDAHLATAVIEIKSQIEKIREQIQNAE